MPRFSASRLLEVVTIEMEKGLIYERPIVGSKSHVEGLCNWESGEISVNPAPSVCDTVIHEVLHRRFPKWSEERVKEETWRVMSSMTPEDVQAMYREYKRIVKRQRKAVSLRNPEV